MSEKSFLVTAVYIKRMDNGFIPCNAIKFIRASSVEEAIGKFMIKANDDPSLRGYSLACNPAAYSADEIQEYAR